MTHLPGNEPAPLSPPYSRYAEVYDRIGQRPVGERLAEATLAALSASGVAPQRVLDLACGTGSAAGWFAAHGMRVTGLDRSPEMIDAARTALAGTGVELAVGDMRELALTGPFDLVTCFYDAVNYLTEEWELAACFARVHTVLAPGGWFVFDVNTRAKFAQAWSDICYLAVDEPDLVGVYRSSFEPDTGRSPLVLTFFERDPGGTMWRRFDEHHVERAYPLALISEHVEAAGFTVEDVRDYQDRNPRLGGPGSERSQRVVFIARRPAEGIEA